MLGGGVWESNPPENALTPSPTVLKTAPITGKDAPPRNFYEFTRTFLFHPNAAMVIVKAALPERHGKRCH